MTAFWPGVALLAAITLAFLLPPLLGRGRRNGVDPDRDRMNVGLYQSRLAELCQERDGGEISTEQFEAAREELQRDLLNTTGLKAEPAAQVKPSRWTALFIALVVPAAALGIYWKIGEPDLISQRRAPTTESIAGDMDKLVEKLKQRLQQQPEDVEGWKLLGRSLFYMHRYGEAAQATGRAVELTASSPDADLLAEYADTLALGNDGSLEGRPIELVKQALALSPDNPRALWLAGIHAYHQQDVRTALKQWRRLAKVLPPGDEMAGPLQEAIAEAESVGRKMPASGIPPRQ